MWRCRRSLVQELAVACGCDAVRGCPSAEWVGSVASEEECFGSYNGKDHSCANEASHVGVCAAPLFC